MNFNPRAPCGARHGLCPNRQQKRVFQSTRPLRGATNDALYRLFIHLHFNPRAPCGARPLAMIICTPFSNFNPRAPCGARPRRDGRCPKAVPFQSTRPLRGATGIAGQALLAIAISIHAPLAGRDDCTAPRLYIIYIFQSTRPLRGATQAIRGCDQWTQISIHAPLAGRDTQQQAKRHLSQNFNPRAPCGARHYLCGDRDGGRGFQSTRPLRGATAAEQLFVLENVRFQSTRPLRGATHDDD